MKEQTSVFEEILKDAIVYRDKNGNEYWRCETCNELHLPTPNTKCNFLNDILMYLATAC